MMNEYVFEVLAIFEEFERLRGVCLIVSFVEDDKLK
jgi:hypothetical protein